MKSIIGEKKLKLSIITAGMWFGLIRNVLLANTLRLFNYFFSILCASRVNDYAAALTSTKISKYKAWF